jgi:hypothetical protein
MVIWRELGKMRAGSQTMTTRPSAVAGMFYPGDPDRLRMHVLDLLADVAASKVMPKALIAPHAGYAYSGRVAAAAFATLRDSAQTITRVVLIGPAHYVHMRGIAAPTVDAFETPLGRVPVDAEALSTVADLQFVIRADAPHAPEHALEVELPFLQILLASFQVVPLLVGDATLRPPLGLPEFHARANRRRIASSAHFPISAAISDSKRRGRIGSIPLCFETGSASSRCKTPSRTTGHRAAIIARSSQPPYSSSSNVDYEDTLACPRVASWLSNAKLTPPRSGPV